MKKGQCDTRRKGHSQKKLTQEEIGTQAFREFSEVLPRDFPQVVKQGSGQSFLQIKEHYNPVSLWEHVKVQQKEHWPWGEKACQYQLCSMSKLSELSNSISFSTKGWIWTEGA